ncbi:MAG: PaaI family thioesterase, partial [Pseudomonadota bacterium]
MSAPTNAQQKPAISDAEMLARFQSSKKRPPCSDTLGMRLTAVDQAEKSIEMAFEVSPNFANPTGAVQGGFVSAMLDEAMSTCCIIASNVTMTAPTLEMKISFLRPLFPGPASVRAQIVKWGKSAAFMEAEAFDPAGKLVAKAT